MEKSYLDKSQSTDLTKQVKKNAKKIRAIRAITYVFDVVIIMVAVLLAFGVDFTKWILIPALGSVFMHTKLTVLYDQKCVLKRQESEEKNSH